MHVTGCDCSGPGWCARHGIEKDRYWFQMCRRLPALFENWNRGLGPLQNAYDRNKRIKDPCTNLGQCSRLIACTTCSGHIQLKVFVCSIYGECTFVVPQPELGCWPNELTPIRSIIDCFSGSQGLGYFSARRNPKTENLVPEVERQQLADCVLRFII